MFLLGGEYTIQIGIHASPLKAHASQIVHIE